MAKKTEETFDYRVKSAELEALLDVLQNPNVELDEASKLYETGLKLVAELEAYLKQAENTVRKHAAERG